MSLSAMMELVKRWLLEAWAQGHAEGYTAGFLDGLEAQERTQCAECGAEVPAGQGRMEHGEGLLIPMCWACWTQLLDGLYRRPSKPLTEPKGQP